MYILFGYHGTLRESKHSKVITNSTRNAWALVYYRGGARWSDWTTCAKIEYFMNTVTPKKPQECFRYECVFRAGCWVTEL